MLAKQQCVARAALGECLPRNAARSREARWDAAEERPCSVVAALRSPVLSRELFAVLLRESTRARLRQDDCVERCGAHEHSPHRFQRQRQRAVLGEDATNRRAGHKGQHPHRLSSAQEQAAVLGVLAEDIHQVRLLGAHRRRNAHAVE
eukprot:4364141-Prymnesium_polylepis.3